MSMGRDVAKRVWYAMPFCGVTGAMERMRGRRGWNRKRVRIKRMPPGKSKTHGANPCGG